MVVELTIKGFFMTKEMIEEERLNELSGKEDKRKYVDSEIRELTIYGVSHIEPIYDHNDLDEHGNPKEFCLVVTYSSQDVVVPYKINDVREMIKKARVDFLSLDL